MKKGIIFSAAGASGGGATPTYAGSISVTQPTNVVVSPDNSLLFIASIVTNGVGAANGNYYSYTRNTTTGAATLANTLAINNPGFDNQVGQMAVATDMRQIIAGGNYWPYVTNFLYNGSGTMSGLQQVYYGAYAQQTSGIPQIHPSGAYVYSGLNTGPVVSVLSRNTSTGSMAISGSAGSGFSSLDSVALSPDGLYLYASGRNSSDNYLVAQFTVSADGSSLSSQTNTTVFTASGAYGQVTVSPDGNSLYVTSSTTNSIYQYSRNLLTGAITLIGTMTTNVNGPSFPTFSPDGSVLYVPCLNQVSVYNRNLTTGVLSVPSSNALINSTVVPGLSGAVNRCGISPDGQFLYIPVYAQNTVYIVNLHYTGASASLGTPTFMRYLVVAGGGGGYFNTAGGGGAGGLLTGTTSVCSGISYTVTVGSGGTGGTTGANGGPSSVFGLTATGGGGGGTNAGSGGPGGSGGGGHGGSYVGGSGVSGQGFAGGAGFCGGQYGAGGGGGAGSVGSAGTTSLGGPGGSGRGSFISGSYTSYAGGGGGGDNNVGPGGGIGGIGGGGSGAGAGAAGTSGTANLGAGGGGGGGKTSIGCTISQGGAGGSGVVILSYPSTYCDAYSTTGSPIYTSVNGQKIYKFTGSGSIQWGSPLPPLSSVCYLIVAGGGGAGGGMNGGSGAGGALASTASVCLGVQYSLTVGAGGAGNTGPANPGSNSTGFSQTAIGGGSGSSPGGSGGGSFSCVGSGTPGQGYPGGSGTVGPPICAAAGGGGGAGGPGSNGFSSNRGGPGGIGLVSTITGSSTYYAGGGGGASRPCTPAGSGGLGGGAPGTGVRSNPQAPGNSGTANTGGGAGGPGDYLGSLTTQGSGGSGVIIVSYPSSYAAAVTTGSPCVSVVYKKRIYKYTGSGSIAWGGGPCAPAASTICYLVVAGGGYGGAVGVGNAYGSGGGAGGLKQGSCMTVTSCSAYTVTVGGAVGDSSFNGISTTHGGTGFNYNGIGSCQKNGGSGAGGVTGAFGAGTGICGQGFPGGPGTGGNNGGGGGGAGGSGSPAVGCGLGGSVGAGGPGVTSSITGTSVTYAVGGGPEPTNTAYGSGGAGISNTGSNGGRPGVVIIAYPACRRDATVTGSPTTSIAGGKKIYKFTGSGTIQF